MSDTSNLLIPTRIRAGFNKRPDTYTGMLAYLIYYDALDQIRQERSWESWRDKTIVSVEFKNEPTEGFVINKGVGGQRNSWGHHSRSEYVRVWDPRNFEIEISVANLLFVLREGTCHPGKGLEGKFVYAWENKKPVLLPVKSLDYEQCRKFTALQGKSVKVRELVAGYTYVTKQQEQWVYLGRFDYFYSLGKSSWRAKDGDSGQTKRQVFAKFSSGKWQIVYQKDTKQIAAVSSESVVDNFAELVDLHTKSARGCKIAKLLLKPGAAPSEDKLYWGREWTFEYRPGIFAGAKTEYDGRNKSPRQTNVNYLFEVNCGILHIHSGTGTYCYHPDYREIVYSYSGREPNTERTPHSPHPWREPTDEQLYALLECGVEVPLSAHYMSKD